MNATQPSQNTTSTRKHTLFDADVAITPTTSNLFCSTNHSTVHPQKFTVSIYASVSAGR